MVGLTRLEAVRRHIRTKVQIGDEFTTTDLVRALATRSSMAPTRMELANLLKVCPEVIPVGVSGDSRVVLWRRVE